MAAITYQPTKASQLQAPDITKAGSLISKAFEKTANVIGDYEVGVQDQAKDVFQNRLREATTTDELGQLGLTNLENAGVDASGLAAAENALRGKQVDAYSNDLSSGYDTQRKQNAIALQNILDKNQGITDNVSLDKGFNPIFATPTGEGDALAASKAEIAADIATFGRAMQQPDSGFSPVLNERELRQKAEIWGKTVGASKAQINKLVADQTAYKNSFSKLTANEQSKIATSDSALDTEHSDFLNKEAFNKQQTITKYGGYGTAGANEILRTKPSDVISYVNNNLGEELAWLRSLLTDQKAGIDIKEYLIDMEGKDIGDTKGRDIKPWMVLQAVKEYADLDEDSENINVDDFEDRLEMLAAKDSNGNYTHPTAVNLQASSAIDANFNKRKLQLEQQLILDKKKMAAKIKGAGGIRNEARNADLFNAIYADAIANRKIVPPANQKTVPPKIKTGGVTTTGGNENEEEEEEEEDDDNTLDDITIDDASNAIADVVQESVANAAGIFGSATGYSDAKKDTNALLKAARDYVADETAQIGKGLSELGSVIASGRNNNPTKPYTGKENTYTGNTREKVDKAYEERIKIKNNLEGLPAKARKEVGNALYNHKGIGPISAKDLIDGADNFIKNPVDATLDHKGLFGPVSLREINDFIADIVSIALTPRAENRGEVYRGKIDRTSIKTLGDKLKGLLKGSKEKDLSIEKQIEVLETKLAIYNVAHKDNQDPRTANRVRKMLNTKINELKLRVK